MLYKPGVSCPILLLLAWSRIQETPAERPNGYFYSISGLHCSWQIPPITPFFMVGMEDLLRKPVGSGLT